MKLEGATSRSPEMIPGKVVVIYAMVSALWIFFSDTLLELLISDAHLMARVGMFKGWTFVLVTATLLFFLVRRYVTQLERSSLQLLEAESRFRRLLEQVHMAAVILDGQGNVVFCNEFLLTLTGWSRQEVLGRSWVEQFIPPAGREELSSIFSRGIASGSIMAHLENVILTREGSERLMVWDNTLMRNPDGTVSGVACLGLDVTEHRNLEAQLRQSQKMESIGTLAGGIAHDFNNILTVILSCTGLMRTREGDPERTRKLVDQVETAAQRAANLTSNLLTFSRKQPTLPRRIDLNQLVITMHSFLEGIIGSNVVLVTDLSREEVPVLADPTQLEQVIMNMIGNARDAMPQGGTVTLHTRVVHLDHHILENDAVVSGRFAVLEISDTGEGILPQHRARIFEPFFTTKEVGKGTGLGLSMVYGIVRQHNGWIELVSEQGKGTSFLIHLPLSG